MKRRRSNTLVALSSAAVMTVYTAGFMRTRAAAEKLEHITRERPPAIPSPVVPTPVAAPEPIVMAPKAIPVDPGPAPAKATAVRTASKAMPPAADPAMKAPVAKPVAKPDVQPETVSPSPAIHAAAAAAPATSAPAKPAPTMPAPAASAPAPAPVAASGSPFAPTPADVAPPPPPATPSAETLLGVFLKDGTYLGWGSSRHGDIQASVTLQYGRLTAVSIAQCRTRYSCDVIAHLPAKVLKDQTPEKINNVSGATQSVDAFYYAVVDALKKAQ